MSSSKSLPGRNKKESSSGDLLGFDFLFALAYLSAVAAAGIPRNQIFQLASQLPCTASRYFRDVDRLAQNMNYQYAEACRLVGESAKDQGVRSLLFRLSSSLASGEPAAAFLGHEAEVQAETYGNVYEGKLESLRKWTDSFTALIVSSALIIVVAVISTVIYDMGTGFVVGLVFIMLALSGLGAWIIYRIAPREIKTLAGPLGHDSQRVPRTMFLILVPSALVAGALLFVAGASLGWALMAAAALLFPLGIASLRYDGRINRMDRDFSTFLRVLGSTASAIGTTPVEALERIDLRSMSSLAPAVKRLHTRLRARISPQLCWRRFVAETGSEVVHRGVRVFMDGVTLGGEAEEVGSRAALLAMKVTFMRAKRKLVSASFGWLSLGTHATIVFLLVFVIEIVGGFGKMVQGAGVAGAAMGQGSAASSILTFSFQNMQFIRWLMVPVVLVLSFVNAIAPKVADGGYSYSFFFYLSLTLFTSGVDLVVVPKLASAIFGGAATF